VEATANVHGHRRVIGRGWRHGHKLTLTLMDLHRGRYQLTLLALNAHGQKTVIGHTSIVVS
jgi:hypothetical protein